LDLFSDSLPFKLPEKDGFISAWDENESVFTIEIPNGEILYSPDYFNKKISDRTVEFLQQNDTLDWEMADWGQIDSEKFSAIQFDNIEWKQDYINLFGKRHPLPRLTSWYGELGKSYTYSGIRSEANDWSENDGLQYIKKELEKIADVQFNSVLLNWYRNGEDYLNWHSDDESEFGDNPVIGSVNFGLTRDFKVRKIDNHKLNFTIPLEHGSVLIMRGEMQHYWQHCVPKRKKNNGSRFNLTFRRIL